MFAKVHHKADPAISLSGTILKKPIDMPEISGIDRRRCLYLKQRQKAAGCFSNDIYLSWLAPPVKEAPMLFEQRQRLFNLGINIAFEDVAQCFRMGRLYRIRSEGFGQKARILALFKPENG